MIDCVCVQGGFVVRVPWVPFEKFKQLRWDSHRCGGLGELFAASTCMHASPPLHTLINKVVFNYFVSTICTRLLVHSMYVLAEKGHQ